ncbi:MULTISPECIES: efflux RND transporter periplasmic adaptor subunit [unclassified Variovorax]|uniref:efflux RND transporter periplasmic adaptor subunit n=1 Tax=unclassified Variovorax TaxID=663243 RepID=UPI000D13854B|nr:MULTISPECIES: efflux RND transporter periplasmic adaptor subunit [unclassified Variovorax]AVQ84972.1 efflux transporter periplasmic adaptor subunit [Variovorax sp. PMC12]QRY35489.1 efflux RND transporter periplasmic adaptor subunit [Variovorax sp. PDNC026]
MKIDFLLRQGGMFALALVLIAGCGGAETETGQAAPPAPIVSVMTVRATRLALTQDLPGRVAAVRVAEIRPQVSGIVQRRLFEQGTEVRAGQGLFQIDPAAFKAEVETAAASVQRAEAALARARTQATRLQPLVEADAVSGQAYDDAVSQREQAAADLKQARATLARRQLDLQFARVEAPISGRIDQALVTEGALVGSGDTHPMARIQQIDQVYVDLRQPAGSLDALRDALSTHQPGSRDGLAVTLLRSHGEPYTAKGRILFSGMNVDAGTGAVLLRVLVDNPLRELLPGMFVRARVPQASHAQALMVPQQAVVHVAGQPQLWVLSDQGQAHRKAVDLGELVGRSYRVRSGLNAGQRVVVEGMERLSEGASVTSRDWKPADVATAAADAADAAAAR